MNNTYKVTDPGALNKYEFVSFTKVMKLDPVTDSWSSVFSVRPESKQSYTLYGAVPSSISLKRIKVKNGHLVNTSLSIDDLAESQKL